MTKVTLTFADLNFLSLRSLCSSKIAGFSDDINAKVEISNDEFLLKTKIRANDNNALSFTQQAFTEHLPFVPGYNNVLRIIIP